MKQQLPHAPNRPEMKSRGNAAVCYPLQMATALRRKHRKATEAEKAAAAGKGAPGAGAGVAVTASAAGDPVAAPATDIEGAAT